MPSMVKNCVGPDDQQEVQEEFEKVEWEHDVAWSENIVIAITEAFLLFKLVEMIENDVSVLWEQAASVGLVILVFMGGICLSRMHGHRKFEHIFSTMTALFFGIGLGTVLGRVVSKIIGEIF